MNKVRAIQTQSGLYLFSALIFVLSTLSPVVSPVKAADGPPTRELSSSMYRVLPDWWKASFLPTNYTPGSDGTTQSLPAWLPPLRLIEEPETRALAQAVTDILVVDSSNTTIVTKTLSADETFTFFAADKDDIGSRQVVTWTLSSPVGTLSPTVKVSTTLDATTVGTATLMATLVTTPSITTTALITVTPGLAARLSLSPTNQTIAAGQAQPYSATAYDQDDNLVGEVTASTTFTIARAALGNWSNHVYTSEIAGQWAITGTFPVTQDQYLTGTATLTVNPDVLSTIVVAPDQVTLTVGYTQVFTSTGFDQFGNSVSVSPNWTTNWGVMNPTSGVTSVFTADTTPAVGRLVTATQNGVSGTAVVDVIHGPVQTFYISPSQMMTQTAGAGFRLDIEAQDEHGNRAARYHNRTAYLTDTTRTTSPTLLLFTDGSWSGVVTITGAAPGVVITVTDAATTGLSNGFAVLPAPLDHIRINRVADNGGQSYDYPVQVGDEDMTIYMTYMVWAAGYDRFDNFREDLSVNWGLTGILAAGEIVTNPDLSATFTPAPILSGTGSITATYVPSGFVDSTGIFTVRAPRLIISKDDVDDIVPAGGMLRYTIHYTNVGNAAVPSARITEIYDPRVDFVWAAPWPSQGDNVWLRGGLGPGEAYGGLFLVEADVNNSLEPGTVLTNLITIGGPRLGEYTFTETTVVTSQPDLELTLDSAPNPAFAGNNLVYQIQYANHGNAPVHNVYITMTYDADVTFSSSDPAPEPGTDNAWYIETVPADGEGAIDVTVVVADYMPDQDALVSTATIKSDEWPESSVAEYTVVNAPNLALTKTASSDPVVAFNPLAYTLVFTNEGHMASGGLAITDAVPANTEYASCGGAPCSQSGGIVTWNLEDGLLPDESGSVTMVVDVDRDLDPGTVLINRARVRVFDTREYAAFAQITTTVVSTPSVWLSISNGTDAVEAGEKLVYTLTYTNTGTGKAYTTTIVATPPSSQHVEDIGCSPSAICQVNGGTVTYNLGTVLGGKPDEVSMLATLRDPLPAGARVITASATIDTATPGDPSAGNSAQDVDEIATRPDLQIQVDYHNWTPYPGKRLTYTLHYSNSGHIATTGVVITGRQPDHTTYDPAASSAWQSVGDGMYISQVEALDYGDSGSLSLVVSLPTDIFTTDMSNFDAAFGIFDDGGSGGDGNPTDNSAPAPLGVPDLIVEDIDVDWKGLLSNEPGHHVTVTLKNQGTQIACQPRPGPSDPPDFCSRFYIDLYVNPDPVPSSMPIGKPFGIAYTFAYSISPGETRSYPIERMVSDDSPFALPQEIQPPLTLWARVDNHEEWNIYGLVPEYDESNNVYGPVTMETYLYLPVLLRGY